MPVKSGFYVAEEIRKLNPAAVIIFLTSHSEFATEGYKYDAHRYVLKLKMRDDLPEAIESAVMGLDNFQEKILVVMHYNDIWKISYSDIISVTKMGRYLQIQTASQGAVSDNRGIKELFDVLEDDRFLVIDRGCFINIDYAAQITGSSIRLTTGQLLPISRRSIQSVKTAILRRWGA